MDHLVHLHQEAQSLMDLRRAEKEMDGRGLWTDGDLIDFRSKF